jgi:hypothetical protein
MSGSQSDSDVVEAPDKDDQARQAWMKAELRLDVPGRARSGAFLSPTRTAKPQWAGGKAPTGDAPKGPTIGADRDLEAAFNRRLSEAMGGIDVARDLKPASDKALAAAIAMEKSLGEMSDAAKAKDFKTAGAALDSALASADIVSNERIAGKKAFEDAFNPLQAQLTASLDRTKGLKGISPAVGVAEQTAQGAAAAAEAAADNDDFARANELQKTFAAAMTALGTAYTDAANLLDAEVGKKIGRLTRRAEGLEGTKLTTEAATAKAAVVTVTAAQSTANSATPSEARLAGLVVARDKADEADAAAQTALKEKFNQGATKGLDEIRKGAKAAIDALPDGDQKLALLARLTEWDKQKDACDKEKDLGKQKTALAKLDGDARQIMTDASKITDDAKKQAALKPVNDAAPDAKLTALGTAATTAISALPDGEIKTKLLSDLGKWNTAKGNYDSAPPAPTKAEWAGRLETFVRKLIDDALAAPAEAKRQEVFKKALEKRFGLVITVPPGMSNTHFDQFYDMLDRLPIQQSSQDSLKFLNYDKTSKGAAFYPGGAKVEMGNFGAAEKWDYKNPVTGTAEPLNAFSVNSLHEIGHAVDEKYRIMLSNKAKPGCGDWKDETLATVIAAFIKDLRASAGTALTATDPTLTSLLNAALTKAAIEDPTTKRKSVGGANDSEKPGPMSPTEWALVKAQLNRAVSIRSDNWPWGSGKAVKLENRAYHEAYDREWVSYDPAARTGTEVRDYQFRSPAEWFAELYAYTWYNKKKAPTGVDKAVTKYMFSAKA